MRLLATVNGADIGTLIEGELEELRTVATAAVREAGTKLRARLQVDATSVLGQRVANAWRMNPYPPTGKSARASALVFTRAPDIIDGFNKGSVIKGKSGNWLAIPLPAAGTGPKGKRMTPALFEQTRGIELRMVYLRGRSRAMLVAENARLDSRQRAQANAVTRKGARFTRLAGRTSVPVFILIPQAKLPKLFDLDAREREALADMATVWARYTN